MRASAGILLAACVCAGAASGWADAPLLRPSRDVDVTYRAASTDRLEQRVRWRAAAQLMRIDPPTAGFYVIVDYVARRMSVVREATRSVIEMAAPDSPAGLVGGAAAAGFVRRGEATVAGLGCTEWQTVDRDSRPMLVCITEDGVLLRAGTSGQPMVSAVSVRYAPQEPDAFRVPADYARQAPRAAP